MSSEEKLPGDVTFNVTLLDDSHLPAGTKQRAISYFDEFKQDVWIAVCSTMGTAQVLIAMAGDLQTPKKPSVHIFSVGQHHAMVHRAEEYGAIIHRVYGSIGEAFEKADELKEKVEKEGKTCNLFSFGFNDDKFRAILSKSLCTYIDREGLREFAGHVFVAAGSGVILDCLLNAFPKAYFYAIQVGKKLKERDRVCVLPAREKFSQPAEYPPPFPTVKEYDGKVWRFVRMYGEEGDIVWNVAA